MAAPLLPPFNPPPPCFSGFDLPDAISGIILIALVSFGFDILNHGMETRDDGWRYLPEMVLDGNGVESIQIPPGTTVERVSSPSTSVQIPPVLPRPDQFSDLLV
ncbi:hypothetical protein L1887_23071 [Cichorium endivia]|nr:hypothetical protein L1887_23071 [Cichorium endivia]